MRYPTSIPLAAASSRAKSGQRRADSRSSAWSWSSPKWASAAGASMPAATRPAPPPGTGSYTVTASPRAAHRQATASPTMPPPTTAIRVVTARPRRLADRARRRAGRPPPPSGRPRRPQLRQPRRGDSPDRDHRHGDGFGDGCDAGRPDGFRQAVLRGRRIRRPHAEVVGPVGDQGPGSGRVAGGRAQDGVRPEQPPGGGHRQVVRADVPTVGAGRPGDVQPVVHQAQHAVLPAEVQDRDGQLVRVSVGDVLVQLLAGLYANGADLRSPFVSPIHADLEGMPGLTPPTATEAPPKDMDGDTRPRGQAIDIGADEAQ